MAIKLCDIQKKHDSLIRNKLKFYQTGVKNYIQFFAANSENSCFVCDYFLDEENLCSLEAINGSSVSLTDPKFVRENCVTGIMNFFQEPRERNQIGDEMF
jgi:hypothetical protein